MYMHSCPDEDRDVTLPNRRRLCSSSNRERRWESWVSTLKLCCKLIYLYCKQQFYLQIIIYNIRVINLNSTILFVNTIHFYGFTMLFNIRVTSWFYNSVYFCDIINLKSAMGIHENITCILKGVNALN